MKTMAVSLFKAHALQVVAQVARSREGVVITKRGKPLAQLLPCRQGGHAPVLGRLAHTLVREGDIVAPLGAEMWEAAR